MNSEGLYESGGTPFFTILDMLFTSCFPVIKVWMGWRHTRLVSLNGMCYAKPVTWATKEEGEVAFPKITKR